MTASIFYYRVSVARNLAQDSMIRDHMLAEAQKGTARVLLEAGFLPGHRYAESVSWRDVDYPMLDDDGNAIPNSKPMEMTEVLVERSVEAHHLTRAGVTVGRL